MDHWPLTCNSEPLWALVWFWTIGCYYLILTSDYRYLILEHWSLVSKSRPLESDSGQLTLVQGSGPLTSDSNSNHGPLITTRHLEEPDSLYNLIPGTFQECSHHQLLFTTSLKTHWSHSGKESHYIFYSFHKLCDHLEKLRLSSRHVWCEIVTWLWLWKPHQFLPGTNSQATIWLFITATR